ncbi:unknown [Clostridium sp. CAG:967]|nr:unknown [Clostridium sp. CAG:967]
MASIKDAFEESYQDNLAFLKFIIFAIPVYYCVHLYTTAVKGDLTGFWWMASITFLLLFGFLIKCTTNVRNGKDHVLPSFNIFNLFWAGIKGTIALGPSIAVNCWLATLVNGLIANYIPEPNTLKVFQCIIWGIFGSIILTGYLCYAKTFKIASAYDFKTISESCMDILVAVLFMIPQILLANAIILIPVTYIIWVFLGLPHPVATFFWSMVLIFNLGMIGHYLAQVDYEAIAAKENSDKII